MEAGQAPEIWTYLPTVHAPFQSREATRHWIDEAFAQQATGCALAVCHCVAGDRASDRQYELFGLPLVRPRPRNWLGRGSTPAYWRTVG